MNQKRKLRPSSLLWWLLLPVSTSSTFVTPSTINGVPKEIEVRTIQAYNKNAPHFFSVRHASSFRANEFGVRQLNWRLEVERTPQGEEESHSTNSDASSLLGLKSLGVDYGTVRTGLAVTCGFAPRPLTVLATPNQSNNITSTTFNTHAQMKHLAQRILHRAVLEDVQQIILGLPLDKNGTETMQAHKTREFAQVLQVECLSKFGPGMNPAKKVGFRGVVLWDERYSSKEAQARVYSSRSSGRVDVDEDGMLDAHAACVILEDYYQHHGHTEIPKTDSNYYADRGEWVKIEDQEAYEHGLEHWKEIKKKQQLDTDSPLDDSQRESKQEVMQRAKEWEQQMANEGLLGLTKKQKKQQRKKKSRGRKKTNKTWVTL